MKLSPQKSYEAMCRFLEAYWERGKSEEIGALLGSMQIEEDGKPRDPALWDDWLQAIAQTQVGEPRKTRAEIPEKQE